MCASTLVLDRGAARVEIPRTVLVEVTTQGTEVGAGFRDPPSLEPEALALRREIAAVLVRAPTLPVDLPAFRMRLVDVRAEKRARLSSLRAELVQHFGPLAA